MVKCAACNNEVQVIFLDKISGTYLKDEKGKKKAVCSGCQKSYTIESLRDRL
jgi:hypothetical protein